MVRWRLESRSDDNIRRLAPRVLFRSSSLSPSRTGTTVEVTRARAGWRYVHFAVRQIAPGRPWVSETGAEECVLVLLAGSCRVAYGPRPRTIKGRPAIKGPSTALLGPRRSVFADYPHALYLPPHTSVRVEADVPTELADGRAPSRKRFEARLIPPEACGFEIRGGGNATRQIVDIMPPGFPADRLLVCEVFTPAGNWSSYPPHKHDTDRPPAEVKLEEIYYYRFEHRDAFGLQRLYDGHSDRTFAVHHGDVMLIRSGYHPFVTSYGYNAYYLNVLAGTRRSMAASDDPRYAALRAWPLPDARVPVVAPPGRKI
jgi:5-deoxy-glucuronate isomerase